MTTVSSLNADNLSPKTRLAHHSSAHEIFNYVTAETHTTSLILLQLERMKEGGKKNSEVRMRGTKGVSDV